MFTLPFGFNSGDGSAVLWDFDQLTTSLWLDFSENLFNATSGGSLPAADAGVLRIGDKSGNGRDLKQVTNPGIRKIAQVNGRDVVLIDGVNDNYALDLDLALSTSTIFFVFRSPTGITAASGAQTLLSGGDSLFNPGELQIITGACTGNLTNERIFYSVFAPFVPNPLTTQVYGYGKTDADIAANTVVQSVYIWDNTAFTFDAQLNGTTDYVTASGGGGFTNSIYPNVLRYVGYRGSNSTGFANIELLELIVIPSLLSSPDMLRSTGALAWRWGNQADLPGGHPYKLSPPLVP